VECRVAEVADHDVPVVAVDEDVVALQVAVHDRVRLLGVQVDQAVQDLGAPALQHAEAQVRHLAEVSAQQKLLA